MSTTRRLFLSKSIAATSGFVAAACLPRIAYAGCTSSTQGFEFNHDNVATIPDWKVGDCELRQASLRVSGNFIILNSQVCTHFTHTKDVWHMTVQLVTRDNSNPSKGNCLSHRKDGRPRDVLSRTNRSSTSGTPASDSILKK